MERTQVLDLMGTLKLYGMRSAYDEIMTTAIKRQHEPPRIVGDLLSAEIAEKQARSINYQLTVAKLPLAKDIDGFDFAGTPVNETLVRDLATGAFVADQRNAVLIGGIGTGKSHLAIAIARALIRNGTRGRFFNVVDLVNRLETEHRSGKQGRIADYLTRSTSSCSTNSAISPSLRPAGSSSSTWSVGSTSGPPSSSPPTSPSGNGPPPLAREDDNGSARPPHSPLRDHRDRQRVLALQEPISKLKPQGQSAAPDRAALTRPALPGRALTVVPQKEVPFGRRSRVPIPSRLTDKTACGAATTSNIVYVAETPSFAFDIEVPELRASYVQVERSHTGSGGWLQQGSDIKVRPGQTYNFEDTDFAVEDLPLYYRVITYTSNDTAGTPTANVVNTGGGGGRP